MGVQAAGLKHVLNHFRQRKVARFFDQAMDQLGKLGQVGPALAAHQRHRAVQAGVVRAGRVGQLFQGARANTARREIDDPHPRGIVVRVGHQAQIRQRVLDFLAFEEAQAAIHLVRDAGREDGVLDHARLRVAAVQHGDLAAQAAFMNERTDFVHDPLGFHAVGRLFDDAHRFAFALVGPQVLAQAAAVVADQRVGGIQDVAERTVVLFQANHGAMRVVALEVGHVADVRTAKGVDGLVIVAHGEHGRATTGQQAQPLVLQGVGVLELVHQNVAEAALVMLAHRRIARQQFIGAQQQLGEVDHAFALALGFVKLIDLDQAAAMGIVGLDVLRTKAFFLGAVDEALHVARRVLFIVDAIGLHQALDGGKLIGDIQDLEALRQAGVAVMRAQHAVAQAVKSADPQAARINRQNRRHTRQHFAGGLIGERNCQQPKRRGLAGLNQPGHAGSEYPGLPAARPGQDQGVLRF
ncbi:hypothetical protein D3C85_579640 [compost metagenome]